MKGFVDFVRLSVKAGDGGNGCVSFLRSKETAFGGPDGGDGGSGGSIYLEGRKSLMTLIDVKTNSHVAAQKGKNGAGKNCSGRGGDDITIYVPLGTCVVDESTGGEIGDITEDGQRMLLVKGGDGGNGNQHYASATNKAPTRCYEGWPGEERRVYLELKIIADVGFVGLPNAGKSTLLKALTNANPEIAPYPFTTLSPNLGVFQTSDYNRRITLADIPGLIEGAHTGSGLGHRFLRHIERTRVLLHVVSPESCMDDDGNAVLADPSPENLIYAYNLMREELKCYSDIMLTKPFLIALNKCDLLTPEQQASISTAFEKETKLMPHMISAADGQGIHELQLAIEGLLPYHETI